MSDLNKWVELTLIKGIGPVKARNLLSNKDIEYVVDSFPKERRNEEAAEKIIMDCRKLGVSIIPMDSPHFPKRLMSINHAPILLYAKGDLELLNATDTVGIVGARRCSLYGKEKAIDLAKDAVANNKVVISGMAKGIDSYSHTSALLNNGKTIAVLGNGVDICYPREHIDLMNKIATDGLLLSEYRPGFHATNYSFVQRNRIIAGMSDILCVVDASKNSGTNSTVEFAEYYGVEVRKYHDN